VCTLLFLEISGLVLEAPLPFATPLELIMKMLIELIEAWEEKVVK
jgi:hypothetical protein